MSLSQSLQTLSQSWTQLNKRVSRSQEEWDDSVRKEFEREYWQTLPQQMPQFIQSIDDLHKVIEKARQKVT